VVSTRNLSIKNIDSFHFAFLNDGIKLHKIFECCIFIKRFLKNEVQKKSFLCSAYLISTLCC